MASSYQQEVGLVLFSLRLFFLSLVYTLAFRRRAKIKKDYSFVAVIQRELNSTTLRARRNTTIRTTLTSFPHVDVITMARRCFQTDQQRFLPNVVVGQSNCGQQSLFRQSPSSPSHQQQAHHPSTDPQVARRSHRLSKHKVYRPLLVETITINNEKIKFLLEIFWFQKISEFQHRIGFENIKRYS